MGEAPVENSRKMGLIQIKKELRALEKDKLVELLMDLYKKNNSVKELLDFNLNPNEKLLFNKYRGKIMEAFFPQSGFGCKLKDGKKAISDFKKIGTSSNLVADLMLCYVETGVQYTNDYGDIDEAFYSSMESTYVAALKLMAKENHLDKFADRAEKVVRDTSEIGWGFHDYLYQVYVEFYPDSSEDTIIKKEP